MTRTQDLAPNTEYRFEVSFSSVLTIQLLIGTAEFFGTELSRYTTYSHRGTKGAVYTWHGCRLQIEGDAESEYVAEEIMMESYVNAHFALEVLRDIAVQGGELGPRVLVVGPENAGKTSVVKVLTAYAVKSERQPVVVNLDPRQAMLSVPGSFTAAVFSSIVDVEEGWGSSPISGPSPIPVKIPLVYCYGLANPEEGIRFKSLVARMALAVTSRLKEDSVSRPSGFIVDAPGAISRGKEGVYDNIEHVVSQFSINVLFVLGSERLYSDLVRKYSNRHPKDTISVIRLDKSSGCVDRGEAYMKELRRAQVRSYFFGSGGADSLAPYSQVVNFDDLNIFKMSGVCEDDSKLHSCDDADAMYGSQTEIYERIAPASFIQGSLLVVTTSDANQRLDVIRDVSVRGYLYVVDVDEIKREVKLLSPQAGLVLSNAIVYGMFPEDLPDLSM